MPHISVVGRRSMKVRLFISALYLILSIGAVTMVVPFMLMVSTSFTSNVDSQEFRIYPRYWSDDLWLYRKFVESEYNEDTELYKRVVQTDYPDFRDIQKPKTVSEQQVKDFDDFKSKLPYNFTLTAHAYSLSRNKISLEAVFLYRDYLKKKFEGDIEKANEAYGESRDYFDMQVPREAWHTREFDPAKTPKYHDLWAFKRTLPPRFLIPVPVEGVYREFIKHQYKEDIKAAARAYGQPLKDFRDVSLPEVLPPQTAQATDWAEFVHKECPFQFLVIAPEARGQFQAFLQKKYSSNLLALNRNYFAGETNRYYTSWGEAPLPQKIPAEGFARGDYADFIIQAVPLNCVRLQTPEFMYRDYLLKKYGSLAKVNTAYGASCKSVADIRQPIEASDWRHLTQNASQIRRQFIARNYRDVTDYIVLHGRSVFNTLVLVLGTIAFTLTVNPLAAYALSRFKLPQTYKILLFCLATMAFPAEVTAIQNFLLLKKFHLLNTYWALFLPGAAQGFSIFLLKGFFDALPQELYEAAELDGASELQMYTRICYAMSKPVLAVIALGAFGAAYGSFLWALLVCQDPKMWTLMVWLQQMASWAPMSMVYAALVLSAIPTLLVFIFCQNIILRGIILPMEK